MTITSKGYAGDVNDVEFARLMALGGNRYAVGGDGDFRVTPVAGVRRVSTAPGVAYRPGVRTDSDSAVLSTIFDQPSGGAWYLECIRSNWSTKVDTLVYLPGPTVSSTVTPAAPPTVDPVTMQKTPGGTDDQPLAWIWVSAASTQPTVFDMRTFPGVPAFAEAPIAPTPSVAGAAWITLALSTPLAHKVSWASGFPSRLVVQRRGRYRAAASIKVGANAWGQVRILVNGVAFNEVSAPAVGSVAYAHTSLDTTLNVGDIVEAQLVSNSSGQLFGGRLELTQLSNAL